MRWKDFKFRIDQRLANEGQDDNVEIWYIDVSFPEWQDDIAVSVDDKLGLSVS